MLTQELAGVYKPTTTPNLGQKAGYNPMHLQVQMEKSRDASASNEVKDVPSTSAPSKESDAAVDSQSR